jgi:hypothetical protein
MPTKLDTKGLNERLSTIGSELAIEDEYFQSDYFQNDYFQVGTFYISANTEKTVISVNPSRTTVKL